WWLPCAALSEGESPSELAMRTVEVQVGLKLADPVVVGARPQKVGNDWHLGLVIAGALGGTPGPLTPPVTGFSLRPMEMLPDQVGLWHRDDLALLAARYHRLRD
ncbi:MAG TPA: hypothetical protein VMK12_29380, partial [Anaeromyxobacteraceae bacterium]|nr:hypothetical protein [Anaeromyxobacteraceae bacterium]